MDKFYLTETHRINKKHPYYKDCIRITSLSKNLYNAVLYQYRKLYFDNKYNNTPITYPSFPEIASQFVISKQPDYYAMNTKVAQLIIKNATTNWFSYLKALKSYHRNKSKFSGKPKIPTYKDKTGRHTTFFNIQSISSKYLKDGYIRPSGTEWMLHFQNECKPIKEVRIVPKLNHFNVEIVYEAQSDVQVQPDIHGSFNTASIDLGVNNLASMAISNGNGIIFDGKPLKHINQFYNKEISKYKSFLSKNTYTSNHIRSLFTRRNDKIKHYMHNISKQIVQVLLDNNVDKLIIGKNDGWKQETRIGKRNNQNFQSIPFNIFIDILKYKCDMVGIDVIITEEAYTSKASSIDADQLFMFGEKPDDYNFSGKRVYRGLYVSGDGIHMNADMNGAINIMRKVIRDQFDWSWIRGCVVNPKIHK